MQYINRLRARILHSSWFCFCIPVRAGFVLISVLSFLLSGAISVIIWFEVHSSYQLTTNERAAFILTGIVETLLFVASVIGLIGVVARKQLFVMIYTYFLYAHFVINIAVGIFFLVTVRASNRQQLIDYCAQVFANTSTESSCTRLMNVSTYVFIAVVAALLLLEFYGVLIATRYVYRLRKQKKDDRSRRLGYFHALSQPETLSSRHIRQASDDIELLHGASDTGPDVEEVVNIQQPNYMPVSTHDRDLPLAPVLGSPQSPPYSLSDTGSVRPVRALPPRPIVMSPVVTRLSDDGPREDAVERMPNPYEFLSPNSREGVPQRTDSGDDGLYTVEVSTTAHSAMMDHATYMGAKQDRPGVNVELDFVRDVQRENWSISTTDSLEGLLDDMHKRRDVQRQHVIDSLDNLVFQLYTLSFFLSPTLLPLLCRVASQFIFYKPRDLDPKLSLRVWFLLLCASNAPSFWTHVRDGATEGRAVILDFVGMGYLPSRLHLVLLDTLILCLQVLLTTISFEVSLHLSSLSDSDSSPIPSSPSTSPSPTPSLEIDRDDDDDRKYTQHHTPTMIIDLRLCHLIGRLRNPIPLASRVDPIALPLPITTPTPLSMHLRAILRRREEAMRRAAEQSNSAVAANSSRTEVGRIPGSISAE